MNKIFILDDTSLRNTKILMDSNYIEDKGLKNNIKYTFHDYDTFLFSLFHIQTAENILKKMQSKIIIACLVMLFLIPIILGVLLNYGLSVVVFYVFATIMFLVYFIYVILWLLYTNKVAMKLIITQFEFWFKSLYLFQWILAKTAMVYLGVNPSPWYSECAWYLLVASFTFWVMLFDAVNIKRGNKLSISCFAAFLFSGETLYYSRISYFRDTYPLYTSATLKLTISNIGAFGDITISLIDIIYQSSFIITIFMFKQIISIIRNPNQCLLITNLKKPIIKYENINNTNNITHITRKHIQKWKGLCISYCCLLCLIYVYNIIVSSMRVFYCILVVFIIIIICCLFTNRIKYIYCSIIIFFILIFYFGIGIFFSDMFQGFIFFPLFGFGITTNYLFKFMELNKFETDRLMSRENEHSSHTKKLDKRENPYYKRKEDPDEFRIYADYPQLKTYDVFRGTLGRIIIHTNSPWWNYMCYLLRLLMLHKHKCKSLHYRIVSQAEMTQTVFYGKLPNKSMEQMRCDAGPEFKMAVTMGEYCEMIVAVPGGQHAFDMNQTLMRNDEFNEDFELGDKKTDYDGIIPRSVSDARILEVKEQGKWKNEQKIFFLKKNMIKVKEKLEMEIKQDDENGMEIESEQRNEYDVLLSHLSECKVFPWMHEYVVSHFPGQEQAHKDARLIQVNENESNANLLQNNNLNNSAWMDYV